MPVPTMFATTMHVAVIAEILEGSEVKALLTVRVITEIGNERQVVRCDRRLNPSGSIAHTLLLLWTDGV